MLNIVLKTRALVDFFFSPDVQLLSSEGLECAYIYSALDQTARKINIGKFVHRKAMVLLVTDVAARGIDIPLLDNVINYNFPSKAKLFLHRVGEQLYAEGTKWLSLFNLKWLGQHYVYFPPVFSHQGVWDERAEVAQPIVWFVLMKCLMSTTSTSS